MLVKNSLSMVLWGACALGFVLEFILIFLAVVMLVISYVLMRDEFHECMLPWRFGWNLLDVTAVMNFPFVPPVLFRLTVLVICLAGLLEYSKVGLACAFARWSLRGAYP